MEEDSGLIDFNFCFNAKLEKLLKQEEQSNEMFSKVAYEAMIKNEKESKAKKSTMKPEDYQRLKVLDIINAHGQERLTTRSRSGHILYYVHAEEVFQILYEVHEETNHGGREPMTKVVSGKYKNITREMIMLFINLCPTCTQGPQKLGRLKKLEYLWQTCVLNIIDLSGEWADPPYKFVLAYQESATKFIVLKPMKKKCAKEIANNLIDIFTLFGTPKCIQINELDLDKDLFAISYTKITEMWPTTLFIVRSSFNVVKIKVHNENLSTYIKRCVRQINKNWSTEIRFLQLQLNNLFYNKIKPIQAMFGNQACDNALQDNQNEDSSNEQDLSESESINEMRHVQNTLMVTCTEDDKPISYTEIEVIERGFTAESDDDASPLFIIKEEINNEINEESTTGIRSYSEVQSDINICQEKVNMDALQLLEMVKQEELYEEETENTCTEANKRKSEVFERGSASEDELHDDIIMFPHTTKEKVDIEKTTRRRSYTKIPTVLKMYHANAGMNALRPAEIKELEEPSIDPLSVRKKPKLCTYKNID